MKKKTVYTLILVGSLASVASLRAQSVFTWNGGSGNWSNSSFWTSGIPNSNLADVFVDGGKTGVASTVFVDGAYTVGRLTIDANDAVSVNNGQSLTLTDSGGFSGAGTLNNAGAFTLNSSGSYTDLFLQGSTRFTGGGTANLAQYARVRGNGTLTNVNNTIQGYTFSGGTLGNDELTIVNQAGGVIQANVSGQTLYVDPGTGGLINTGTLRALNGGTLELSGYDVGTFTNTGGTIQAQTGSTVLLTNGASVTGGTLTTAGTGVIRSVNSTVAGVANAGSLLVSNGDLIFLNGTITDTGTITLASTGSYTDLYVTGGTTLTGSGSLNLSQYARVRGTGTLTNAAGHTIQGYSFSGGSLGNDEMTLSNAGLIVANVSGQTLIVDPGSGNLTNTGTLRASGGGTLQLNGYDVGVFNNSGVIEALNNPSTASVVQLTGGASVVGGTLNTTGNGVIGIIGSATLTNTSGAASISVDNGSNLTLVGSISNSGSVTLASTGSFTDLYVNGNTTLTGGGSLNLSSAARVRSAGTLTIAAGYTVQGETNNGGTFGNDELTIKNFGLINANVSGLALVVDPGSGGLTNTGTMQAGGGGILLLTGYDVGVFNNAGGTIQALAGSEVQLTGGASITGGTLTTTGTGAVRNISNASLANLANTGLFVSNNGSTTTFTGTITNTGTINVGSTGSFTDLYLNGNVTLTGGGTMTLSAADRLRGGGGTLTNVNNMIQGYASGGGSLGNDELTIVNQTGGLILANVSGQSLLVDPGAGGLTNTGTMRASAGGVLLLSGYDVGTFTNTGGTIQALAGSEVQLTGSASVTGGTLTTTGTGVVRNVDNASLANLTNAGSFVANNGSATTFTGTITNTGSINIGSSGSFTELYLNGNVTLAGTGTMTISAADRLRGGGGTLTNAAGHTIQGYANGGGTFGNDELTINNAGLITANVSGQSMLVDPGAGGLTNTGTLRATNGGTMNLSGYDVGRFTNNGVFDVQAGSAINVDAGALTNYSGTTLTGGKYLVTGSGAAGGVATLNLGGGTITTNAATVVLSGSNSTFAEINALATNQGTFGVTNGRNFTTLGALSDPGIVVAGSSSTLTVAGGLTETAAGTLAGTGTMVSTSFALSGKVAPGGQFDAVGNLVSGAGTLTLTGSTTLGSSAILLFELGAANFTSSDHLVVNGAFTLDGTLNVTALSGFGAGRYDLVDYTGTFTNNTLDLGTLPAGYNYRIDTTTAGRVDLVVSAVPEPGTWAWLASGVCALAGWTRRTISSRRRSAC